MSGSASDDRARKMQLLARVEQARETRCRAVLRDAEAAWSLARSRVDAAGQAVTQACDRRHHQLRAAYDALLGERSPRQIHALRMTELHLAQAEAAARTEQKAAEDAADTAVGLCREAAAALQAASLRTQRRTKLADTLRREAFLAAQNAEEEATADELMDRIGAAS
ncbi:hypothetical protein [Rhizosaccharibacter radicis]|uniref:Type III secretion protein HrpB7 n=1 Tax=Rhizosaccharibacter radicis TaxID=2782605 RepID=A0ABT1VTV8_9PROT|nr:hypothetical protein [Acetobacteraceae bacterium KSS12]